MRAIKLLGISGSLRKASRNSGLLRYAAAHAPEGVRVEIAQIAELPFYNADLSAKPPAVERFLAQLKDADALLLASPEYNYSIAPALKNALDWASREADNHLLAGKAVAMLGAGGGMGTSRAQYHLRQVCVCLDLHVLNKPEFFANAFSESFDAAGELIDAKLQALLVKQLVALADLARQLAPGERT